MVPLIHGSHRFYQGLDCSSQRWLRATRSAERARRRRMSSAVLAIRVNVKKSPAVATSARKASMRWPYLVSISVSVSSWSASGYWDWFQSRVFVKPSPHRARPT